MVRIELELPEYLRQSAEEQAAQQDLTLEQFIQRAIAEKVSSLDRPLDDPQYPQITYRWGASGVPTPIVKGTGIRVQTIGVAHTHWDMSAQKIADDYSLQLEQVEEALAFFEAKQPLFHIMFAYEDGLKQAAES